MILKTLRCQIHPSYNRQDMYHLLHRQDQVIIVRLRTGHYRLIQHMFTKLHTGHCAVFPCGTSPVTVEHLLQDYLTHQNLGAETWSADTAVREMV